MIDELTRSRIGVRMLSVLLALDLAKNFVSPALWIMGETSSVVSNVSRLATWPDALAGVFIVAAVLVAPYIVMQLICPMCERKTQYTQWACRGMLIGGVLWFYMAYLSRNLDYDVATSLFVINGVFSMAMAAILGYGINLEQLDAEDAHGACA